jgi:ketosteroid isomerase-like protein
MTAPELEAFCLRYMAAVNSRDTDVIAELYHEDVVWHDPALPQPAHGWPEVADFLDGMFRGIPDLRVVEPDPPHRSATGDDIAWAWRTLGTIQAQPEASGTATIGHQIDQFGVDLWRLRDGRIALYRAVYDLSSLMGSAPAPTA